jgi:hypothetical protein
MRQKEREIIKQEPLKDEQGSEKREGLQEKPRKGN